MKTDLEYILSAVCMTVAGLMDGMRAESQDRRIASSEASETIVND